ncbi:MAG TPA: glycosyltransferase family 39 protein [Mycobacteriales bacterium]|nr:glycosyltransferase family 39 protein [Mycobacteriales bacterium]
MTEPATGASETSLAVRGLLLTAGVVALVMFGFSARYGYHRDELYFIACGHHLAWGYPDQPPLVPFIARLMTDISPHSLMVLRLPSDIAVAGTVFLTGMIARELGAGPKAQVLAAVATAVSNVVIGSGHLLSTTTFGLTAWAGTLLLALRAVRTGNDRSWLWVGAVAGAGLLDNDLQAFLVAALVCGVVACGPRRIFRSPWLWMGAVVMLAMWSPYVVWQAAHSFPELTIARAIANGSSGTSAPRWQLIPFQFVLAGIAVTPLWVTGLIRLIRSPSLRWARAVAVAYILLVVVFLIESGKPYYLSGMLPVLYAAGAAPVFDWWRRARGRTVLAVAAVVVVVVGLPVTLPIVPPRDLHNTPIVALNYDAGETVAWPTYVDEITAAYSSVGSHPVVITRNYGELGAIDRYRDPARLPAAYGVQNSNWLWGPPRRTTSAVLAVGFAQWRLTPLFADVRLVARLDNHLGVDDDEQGVPVWVCTGMRQPWPTAWRALRNYG